MKKLGLTLVVALTMLFGAGSASAAIPPILPGPSCSPSNVTMQCILAQQPKPHLGLPPKTGFVTKQGWDFAWSCPDPGNLSFGASYLSPDPTKNWSNLCVNKYHSRGKTTVPVWESAADRTAQGFGAGVSDAQRAEGQALSLGMPASRPIDFAIDFDANGPEVADYFRGCDSVLGKRCNAYGGFRPLLWLYQHGLVGHTNWQTYAWSGGAWLPASIAPLEQYLNTNSVDYDRAIAPDFGQWPFNSGPSQATIRAWRAAREKGFASYRGAGADQACQYPQQTVIRGPVSFPIRTKCQPFANAVIANQHKLWTVYKKWSCFGKGATKHDLNSEICWVIRPEVHYWSGARHATWLAYKQHQCKGPIYFSRKGRRPVCTTLSNRWRYFNAKANQTVRAYS